MTNELQTQGAVPHVISVPSGMAENGVLSIDLAYWARQEARIQEVAIVTSDKAAELLSTFNSCCLDLDDITNKLNLEVQLAQRAADSVKARVIIDEVPTILAAKKLATAKNPMGSEDLRNAILGTHEEYQQALRNVDTLKALTKLMQGKRDAFERAWRSVRALVSERTFNPNRTINAGPSTTSGGIGSDGPVGFGKARL